MSKKEATHKAIDRSPLPPGIKEYLHAYVNKGVHSGLRRMLKSGPARVLDDISFIIGKAAKTTGISAEEVLFATGFHPGDFSTERLEAALAELRAANFLSGEGFSAIRFVRTTDRRTADITASRGENSYAFEVRCVTGSGVITISALEKKYRKKMPQAVLSKKDGGFSYCGIIFVIAPHDPFSKHNALTDLAQTLYEKVGCPRQRHICVLSGNRNGISPGWQ